MTARKLLEDAQLLRDEIVRHRRFLHSHAEIGFDLTETRKYIFTQLTEMGYTPQVCGKSGVKAVIGEGEKCILLRADADALPIKEQSGVDFASEENMHACGHDMHTAMLLGAAKLLKMREHRLTNKVVLMFQPSEEDLKGAKDMIDNGITEGVDGAVMIHVITAVDIPAGTVIVNSPGVSAPASDHFTIEVKGKGCHGGAPWQGVDAGLIVSNILIALQTLQAREINAAEETVLTLGYIQAGSAGNAIADKGVLKGTARSYSEDTRKYIQNRIITISRGVADTFGGSAEVIFTAGAPELVNDKALSEKLEAELPKLLGEHGVITTRRMSPDGSPMRGGGSEDFAYICKEVPGVMLSLCAGEPAKGFVHPCHHPAALFDESVLTVGAAVYAYCATLF